MLRQTRSQWLSRALGIRPRPRPQKAQRSSPIHPERAWLVTVDPVRVCVWARTAGEARARAKEVLGVGRNGRLPVGAIVEVSG